MTTTFREPKDLDLVHDDIFTLLISTHIIIDPYHPVPEPNLSFSDNIFNGWFGIPFQDTLSFTHIRSPHFSNILSVYGLTALIRFYPTIFSFTQIQQLSLSIFLLQIVQHNIPPFFPIFSL